MGDTPKTPAGETSCTSFKANSPLKGEAGLWALGFEFWALGPLLTAHGLERFTIDK